MSKYDDIKPCLQNCQGLKTYTVVMQNFRSARLRIISWKHRHSPGKCKILAHSVIFDFLIFWLVVLLARAVFECCIPRKSGCILHNLNRTQRRREAERILAGT